MACETRTASLPYGSIHSNENHGFPSIQIHAERRMVRNTLKKGENIQIHVERRMVRNT